MPGMKEQLIRDGVAQMAQILNGRSGLDSIQIVSHGSVGALYLGSTGADVAASNDVTGAGGDWVLEQTFRAALRTAPRRLRWATTSC